MNTEKQSKTEVDHPPHLQSGTLIVVTAGVATLGGVLAASALPRPSSLHSETRVPFLLGISLSISLVVGLTAVLISRAGRVVSPEPRLGQ